jgi:signal transduction histidine kinase
MGLSAFITLESAKIMDEFEAFALQQLPAAADMDVAALRDHARQVLAAIALDMRQPQTGRQQREKSLGHAPRAEGAEPTPAEIHGELRASAGFNVNQTAAEYRALRASVIRLWMESGPTLGREEVIQMTRFNEAMDEALAASILHFAAEAARMRNLFLGVLSHELRTPLSTVMASSQSILLAAGEGKVLPKAAERSLRGARRIQSLLDDLLDYVRAGLGEGMRVTPTAVDMGEACARIVGELRASHPDRLIEVEASGDMGCVCDEQRMAQAISNLLGNALRHGAPGEPVVVRADGSEAGEITVSVQNAGPQIPKAAREGLFEPMARGADASHAGHNLGLGLYIVREIALAHGGSVGVESDAALGTVFAIKIPRDAGGAAASAFPRMRMD